MKKSLLFLLLFPCLVLAQVGVNTTTPNAALDVRSTNQTTPANTDGLLIPKVDNFPAANPGANQNGMLVYVTGSGTPSEGFYYWNNALTAWIPLRGAERINDLIDGKSDVDGSEDGSSVYLGIDSGANDDSSDNKNVGLGFQVLENGVNAENNVGIGYRALRVNTGTRNTAIGHTALSANTTGNNNTAIGGQALSSNTTGNSNIAIGAFNLANNDTGINNVSIGNQGLRSNVFGNSNTALGDYAGRALDINNASDLNNNFNTYLGSNAGNSDRNAARNVYVGYEAGGGNYNIASASGTLEDKSDNIFIGYQAGYDEANSQRLYIENSSADADAALIYGEFDNDILRINGTLQVSNPTGTGYALPATDGTANQILVTDGNGSVTWENNSAASFSVSRTNLTNTQTLTVANNWTKLSFDAVDFDLNGDFDTANNVFDVPVDGIYRITAMYKSDVPLNNSDTYGIRISVGGSNLQEVNYKHMNQNSKVVRQVSTIAELNAGDTIEVQARANVASVLTIDSASRFTSFSVERIR